MANALTKGALSVATTASKKAKTAASQNKNKNASDNGSAINANASSFLSKSGASLGNKLLNFTSSLLNDNSNENPGNPNSSWGYGSWGGGGGGSTGVTPEQEKAAKALGGVAAAQAQAAKDKFKNVKDTLDAANANARKTADLATHAIGRAASSEWYHNALENPQKVAQAMKEKAGNALSGSMRWAFDDDFQRVTDDATVDVINNQIDQTNDVMYELANTINKNITEQNKMAADIQGSLSAGAADFFTQLINMHPDLVGKNGPYGALLKESVFKDAKTSKKLTTKKAANSVSYPSFLSDKNFYKDNKTGFVTPQYIKFGREANARQKARGLQAVQTNVASAANPEYVKQMGTNYGSRKY